MLEVRSRKASTLTDWLSSLSYCSNGFVPWSPGLRPGSRQAFTAKWLGANYCTNLVAIHVDVAGLDAPDDLFDPRIDTRVNAESQSIALRVYRVDHRVNFASGKAGHM